MAKISIKSRVRKKDPKKHSSPKNISAKKKKISGYANNEVSIPRRTKKISKGKKTQFPDSRNDTKESYSADKGKYRVPFNIDSDNMSGKIPEASDEKRKTGSKEKEGNGNPDKSKRVSFFQRLFKKKKTADKRGGISDAEEIPKTFSEKTATRTKVDEIMDAVESNRSVKTDELSKKMGVERERIEEWVKILEEHGLVSIHYTVLGSMEVRRPVSRKKKVNPNEDDE